VGYLVTTTPEHNGRSFGTNVLEAVFVVLIGKPWADISSRDYLDLLEKIDYRPRLLKLSS
jgi:hypothetical protein